MKLKNPILVIFLFSVSASGRDLKTNIIKESPSQLPHDSLIAKGWQKEQYIGVAILLIALISIIGFFSRRFEYALIFSLTLSIILIVFLLTG